MSHAVKILIRADSIGIPHIAVIAIQVISAAKEPAPVGIWINPLKQAIGIDFIHRIIAHIRVEIDPVLILLGLSVQFHRCLLKKQGRPLAR